MDEFWQYLILFLISMLFAKDYLLPPILKKLGFGNGNKKVEEKLETLETNHLHTINETLERIENNLTRNFTIIFEKFDEINKEISYLKGKMNGK